MRFAGLLSSGSGFQGQGELTARWYGNLVVTRRE
jgi:hypothetical protein